MKQNEAHWKAVSHFVAQTQRQIPRQRPRPQSQLLHQQQVLSPWCVPPPPPPPPPAVVLMFKPLLLMHHKVSW